MAEEKLETSLDDAVAGLPAVGAKVFVGNLAYSTSWQVLKDHMRKAGPVVRADVMTNADGRSKVGAVVCIAAAGVKLTWHPRCRALGTETGCSWGDPG